MAFSKNRRLSDLISADGTSFITSSHITDTGITHADLHTNMDLTSKTVLVANASTGDSDTTAANTAFVQQEIAALVDSSPSALNTLNELAAALGDDANFSTTVTNSIATKLPLAGGTMTGNLVVAFDSNNSGNRLRIADTEGVSAAVRTYSTSDGTGLILNHYYAVGGSPYVRYSDFVSSMGDGAATNMRFLTKPHNGNPTVALTIDQSQNLISTGYVGIGFASGTPLAKLDIKGDTDTYAGMSKIYLTDTSSDSERRNWAIGNGGSGFGHFTIGVSNAADGDPMASGTHTTPLVIDHEGHVSIGGYAHPGVFYAGANQLVVGNSGAGDQGMTIYTGTGDIGRIHFADGTSGNAEYAGFIAYNHSSNVLQIGAGGDGGTDIVLNNNAVGIGTSTTVPASGAKLEVKGTYASTAPATSGTTDSMTLRLSQSSGTGVLDRGWGDQGSNGHFWLQSRLSNNFASNFAIGLNPNGGNVFIGQKFTNKGALTISEAGNTAGAAIDGVQLYKGLTNASNFLAWQQGNMGWRLGIRHNDGGYPLTLYMNSGSTPTAASPGDEILRFGTDQNMALNNTTTGWAAWGADTATHLTVGNTGNSPTQSNYGVLHLLGSQSSANTHFSIGAGGGNMYMAYDYGNAAHRLTVNSSGTFTGSASNDISDQRLKENIVTIPNALDKVKALKGRTFTWKVSSKQAPGTKYGFIAQEVESVSSDLVYKDSGLCKIDSDDNPIHDIHNYEGDAEYAKSVQTSGIIPILVEAMKEQQTIIDDLKSRIETLEG